MKVKTKGHNIKSQGPIGKLSKKIKDIQNILKDTEISNISGK